MACKNLTYPLYTATNIASALSSSLINAVKSLLCIAFATDDLASLRVKCGKLKCGYDL